MKLIIVLFAVVVAASAFPGYEGWHDPWRSSGWQDPWAVKSAWNPWQSGGWNPWQSGHHHHHEEHVHAIQVPQPHPIPPIHPKPLHLKVHSQAHQFHYHDAKPHHPHLIGYEVYHEPKAEIKHVHGHHSSW